MKQQPRKTTTLPTMDSVYLRGNSAASEFALTAEHWFEKIIARRKFHYQPAHYAVTRAAFDVVGTLLGGTDERWTFGLGTGGGKSTGVVALEKACVELGLDDVGFLVAQSHVKSLCELTQDAAMLGVRDRVTLLHGTKGAALASDNHTPDEARQFVHMSHARALDYGRLARYMNYQGKRRLLLFDEAVGSFAPVKLYAQQVAGTINELKFAAIANPALRDAADYLVRRAVQLEVAFVELVETKAQSKVVELYNWDSIHEQPTFEEFEVWLEAITRTTRINRGIGIEELLYILAAPEVVVSGYGRQAIISMTESVPGNVAPAMLVLDASHVVDRALKADPTIQSIEKHPFMQEALAEFGLTSVAQLRDYAKLKVRQVKSSGSYTSLVENAIVKKIDATKGKELRDTPEWITFMAEEIVAGVKDGMPVLAFHYRFRESTKIDRERGRDELYIRKLIEAEVRRIGGDGILDRVYRDERLGEETRPFVNFLLNGNELASNSFSHCRKVIFGGIQRDDEGLVHARVTAARGSLHAPPTDEELDYYTLMEKVHRVFQGGARGSIRMPGEGDASFASPMELVIIDADARLRDELVKVWPGLVDYRMELGIGGSGVIGAGGHLLAAALERRERRPWKNADAKAWTKAAVNRQSPSTPWGSSGSGRDTTWSNIRKLACQLTGWRSLGHGPAAMLVPTDWE